MCQSIDWLVIATNRAHDALIQKASCAQSYCLERQSAGPAFGVVKPGQKGLVTTAAAAADAFPQYMGRVEALRAGHINGACHLAIGAGDAGVTVIDCGACAVGDMLIGSKASFGSGAA